MAINTLLSSNTFADLRTTVNETITLLNSVSPSSNTIDVESVASNTISVTNESTFNNDMTLAGNQSVTGNVEIDGSLIVNSIDLTDIKDLMLSTSLFLG